MRRILAICFPRLASDHALRLQPVAGAFALVGRTGSAEALTCLNTAASARGLQAGMPLADARAILPDLVTRRADPAAQASALLTLCRWAGRYAPLVAADGPDGLLADITGVAHLFGGEAGLCADLSARLDRAGLSACTAIAGTPGAARALARHGGGIAGTDAPLQGIGGLPVTALGLPPETASALIRLGHGRIADLARAPRAPFARRFGPGLLLRLDQALGQVPTPLAAAPAPPHFATRLTLPEPIGLTRDVAAGLDRLLARLCHLLDRQQMGARRLALELRRVDRATVTVDVGLARPMRDPARIAKLFADGIAGVDAGFGIDALRLSAPLVEPLAPEQLSPTTASPDTGLADLISRLGNRLGFAQIQRLLPAESLIPERSFHARPATLTAPPPLPDATADRPLTLFPPEPLTPGPGHPPQRFTWRRMRLHTAHARGPERIAPDWWRDDPAWHTGLRDYWRIDTAEGPRLWLFYTPQTAAWQVAGEFA